MQLKEKELKMIGHFRNNSRTSLTQMSKLTKIPVSTLFDKLKEYESKNLIRKHTSLLDFKMLGYDIRTQMLISAERDRKDELQKFLIMYPKVNTVFRVNNGFDFLIEAIFRNMAELDEFTTRLDTFNLTEKKEFFIMEEMKREEFLAYKDNLGVQH